MEIPSEQLKEPFVTLTDGSSVTWNTRNKLRPTAKLTSTQSFALVLQNLKDGAYGILKLTTSTGSAITIDPDDTTYTFKSIDNVTITDHTFPAATGKDYWIEFFVQGTNVLLIFNDYSDAPATAPSVVCAINRTTNQAITTATFTSVQFTTEESDLHAMFDSGVSSTLVTIPGSGAKLAKMFFHSEWPSNATGIRRIRLLLNGSNAAGREFDDKPTISGQTLTHNLSAMTVCAGGDTLAMQVYQSSGSDLNLSKAFFTVEITDIA